MSNTSRRQGTLAYNAKVTSSMLPYFMDESLPMASLPAELDALSQEEKACIWMLDLSGNNLISNDVALVGKCVDALQPQERRFFLWVTVWFYRHVYPANLIRHPTPQDGSLVVSLRNNRLYECMDVDCE